MQVISSTQVEVLENNWKACPEADLLNLFNGFQYAHVEGYDFGDIHDEFSNAEGIQLLMAVKDDIFWPILKITKGDTSICYEPENPITAPGLWGIPYAAAKALVENWKHYKGSPERAFNTQHSNERVERYFLEESITELDTKASISGNSFNLFLGIDLNKQTTINPLFTVILAVGANSSPLTDWHYYDYVGACPPNCE